MNVEKLLEAALVPDSAVIRDAEARLKEVTKTSEGCGSLLQVLTRVSSSSSVRQLAVTLLRRHLPKHWDSVSVGEKGSVKGGLLELVVNERDEVVRGSIAMLVSAVAAVEPWPELPQFAATLVAEAQPVPIRTVGFALLRMLVENTTPEEQFPVDLVLDLTAKAMRSDPNVVVRINALRAFGTMALRFSAQTSTSFHFYDLSLARRQLASSESHEHELHVGFSAKSRN